MIRLSTHILDTSKGAPAGGVRVRLFQAAEEIAAQQTDADGRCQNLLATELPAGIYRLVFEVGAYFPDGLYPEVAITFRATGGATHFHIPLLISPFGYTTYRGS